MTWEQVHRRNRVVRDIVDRATEGHPPLAVEDLRVIETEFSDLGDFLLQVHTLWARAVDARVDTVLERQPLDPRAAIREVLDGLARDLPGARRVLDEYADNPVLERAVARHERLLLDVTGVDLADLPVQVPRERQRVPACAVRRRLRSVRVSFGVAR